MQEFKANIRGYTDCSVVRSQVSANVENVTAFGFKTSAPHRGTATIVGSGPSLRDTIKDIDLDSDIFAINGAVKYLVDNSIVPDVGFYWDPSPFIIPFVYKHTDILYLVASQVVPVVFEKLKGHTVCMWHASVQCDTEDMVPLSIGGGSTGVTRLLYVLYAMGYRKVEVHGVDSCFTDDKLHVNKQFTTTSKVVPVIAHGVEFLTTPGMAEQAREFFDYQKYLLGLDVTVHGKGLVPWIALNRGQHVKVKLNG